MAIIDTTTNVSALQDQLRADVNNMVSGLFKNMVATYENCFRLIWMNARLTPQQCFDTFGGDAASLFQMAALLEQLIVTVKPDAITFAPPKTYTVNPDGTVTVTS